MPRPNKVFTRMREQAAAAYKRGDREEAYKLWEKAAAGLKELREKKRNKKKKAAAQAEAEKAESTSESSE